MIVFYDKETGIITGTIGGRVNSPEEFNMWVGDKEKTDRIIIQWKSTGTAVDKEGNKYETDFVPDHPQKEICAQFDKRSMSVYEYKIDLADKSFLKLPA